ncbi:MAG: hypothetical protein WC812_04185 [Candidatus Pacearchaeota archaeon]|jgi:hypothetical protein
MGIRIGSIDIMKLIFEIMNILLSKGIITEKEGDEIIKSCLDPTLSNDKKEEILNSLKDTSEKTKNGKNK